MQYRLLAYLVAPLGCPRSHHCLKTEKLIEATVEATQVAVLEDRPLRAFSKRIPCWQDGIETRWSEETRDSFFDIKDADIVLEYEATHDHSGLN